jgi:DNA-binding response OmpR family regulator
MYEENCVLIAEDDDGLRDSLEDAFRREGFSVISCADGQEAWDRWQDARPGILVLDISMPRLDGLELLKRIRRVDRRCAAMFLTSRDEEFDRVLGLELGADDYLGKPFSLRELIARVRVLARRIELMNNPVPEDSRSRTSFGELELDHHSYRAYVRGVNIGATITEFRLLESMMKIPGQVKTRDVLMGEAYPDDVYVADRTIDCHIKRLRKKIHAVAGDYEPIETVYGLGYALRAPEGRS